MMWANKKSIVLAVVLGAVFLVYFNSLGNEFTNWDDPPHVTSNPDVYLLNRHHLKHIFESTVNATYVPLTIVSFAVEYALCGFNPYYYHLDNLLLHLAVIVLIFFLARRLGATIFASALAGLIFGIHPMHVEAVAWISERKGLLYSFFYLSSLLLYFQYLKSKNPRTYVFAFLAGLLGILSKPMALSLPLVMLLCDWFFKRRDIKRAIIEKIPFLAMMVSIAAITFLKNQGLMRVVTDLPKAILILMWTFTFYIRKFFWPDIFVPDYALPQPVSLFNGAYALSFGIIVLLVYLVWRWRSNRFFIFAILFYIFSIFFLLRFSTIHTKGLAADRFMYLPSTGICIFLWRGVGSFYFSGTPKIIKLRRPLIVILIVMLVLLGAKTVSQVRIWHDSVALWNYVMEHTPAKAFHYYQRGDAFYRLSRYDLALKDLDRAVLMDPRDENTRNNRANTYSAMKLYDLAIVDINKALETDPNYEEGYLKRGTFYRARRDYQRALADFNKLLAINPDNEQAYNDRGATYAAMDLLELAFQDYGRALAINPDYLGALNNRAAAYISIKEFGKAETDLNRALAVDPHYDKALHNLASLYVLENKPELALAEYGREIQADPAGKAGYISRAILNGKRGRFDLAATDLTFAIQIDPSDAQAYFDRAYAYVSLKKDREALEDFQKAKSLGHPINEKLIKTLK